MRFLTNHELSEPDRFDLKLYTDSDIEYFNVTGKTIRLRLATRAEIHAAERDIPALYCRSASLVICAIVRRVSADKASYALGALQLGGDWEPWHLEVLSTEWSRADPGRMTRVVREGRP